MGKMKNNSLCIPFRKYYIAFEALFQDDVKENYEYSALFNILDSCLEKAPQIILQMYIMMTTWGDGDGEWSRHSGMEIKYRVTHVVAEYFLLTSNSKLIHRPGSQDKPMARRNFKCETSISYSL